MKISLHLGLLFNFLLVLSSQSLSANEVNQENNSDKQIAIEKQTNIALDLTESEIEWLNQHPTLKFTGDPNWLPFEAFDKNQKYIGIVAEHIALIEKKLNIHFIKIPTKTWSESVALAKSGEVDILSETDDSALKSHILFSDNYLVNPVVIVMKNDENYVQNLEQIKDKNIGVIRDYGYVTKITNKYPQHRFTIVNDIQDGLLAVSTGRVDAFLCTVSLYGYTIAQLSLHDIKIVGPTEFDTRLAFGVNKSLAEFVPILNKAIKSITEEERQNILERWSNKTVVEKINYDLIWSLLIISAIIFLLLFYRQRQLALYNRKLSLSESRYARVVRGTSDGVWDWDIVKNKSYFSPRFAELLGYQQTGIIQSENPFFDLVHPDDLERVKNALKDHLAKKGDYDLELKLRHQSGQYRWYRNTGQAEWDSNGRATQMAGSLSDITDRKLSEALDKSRNHVLELIAQGQHFHPILNAIIDSVEKDNNNMICSILLVDAKKGTLSLGAAPSLPDFYNEAIEGLKIGDGVGSCGTAAASGKRVIVENIQTHPYWQGFQELAGKANLASCWSEPILSSKGEVVGTFGIYQHQVSYPTKNDLLIIEQAATLAEIAIEKNRSLEELQLASMVYKNSSEAMLIFDNDRTIISVNPAFTQITGYSAEEVLGKKADILNSQFHEKTFYDEMQNQVKQTGFWQGEVIDKRKNGEKYVKWLIVNTIYNSDGSVHRRLSLFSDITEKRQSEEIIWKQANFDNLTGLPNRNMFQERLAREIKHSKRENLSFALLLIDLDHFKEVNDTLGHDVGDILLVEAAKRISESVRESDTVARLGGDEFTIIISDIDNLSSVETVAQKILKELTKPFYLKNQKSYVSASIGITFYPEDASDNDLLLKNADQAMYESKKLGRNRYRYFTASMQQNAQMRMDLITELRTALEKQQFILVYQPIVDLMNNTIYKAEALIRWQHPLKGLISPNEFIPIAEETGIIQPIGKWVLDQAATQVIAWRKQYSQNFQISVNTSPAQYQKDGTDFVHWSEKIKSDKLLAESIIIEITENLMMDANERVIEQLIAFRNSGIQVALDDFGTGYSSLAYLNKFDIDYIKIDKTFVKDLESEVNNRALCEAIIMMAHKLNLKVIAEGIETQQQQKILTEMGCDFGQGYWFSKPIETIEFVEKYFRD